MTESIRIPQLGLSAGSVRVVKWLARVGQVVDEGAEVAEVETDKAIAVVESPVAGRITEVLVAAGAEVAFGSAIATIETLDEAEAVADSEAVSPTSLDPGEPKGHAAARSPSSRKSVIVQFPAVRRRARELGIDLAVVEESHPGRQLTISDVEGWRSTASLSDTVSDRREDMASSATVATASWQVPQVWFERRVDLSLVLVPREAAETTSNRSSVAIDYILAACGRSLVNSQSFLPPLGRDGNLGVGYIVATRRGMVAPVIRGLDRIGVHEIGDVRRRLVAEALEGRLRASDLDGGQFTVSNLGSLGIDRFAAMVVPGQTAILSIGRVTDSPSDVHRSATVSLILTVDHRVVDGQGAALFLGSVAECLESSESLVGLEP